MKVKTTVIRGNVKGGMIYVYYWYYWKCKKTNWRIRTKGRFKQSKVSYLYIWNNNQINDKNEANPDLVENNEIEIFTLETIGLSQNACTLLLQYFAMLYNKLTFTENAYEDNGNIMGIDYDKDDKELDSQFEKLEYNEKLDVFSEVIIRYDNKTYFTNNIVSIPFDTKTNGFDIAHLIQKQKV